MTPGAVLSRAAAPDNHRATHASTAAIVAPSSRPAADGTGPGVPEAPRPATASTPATPDVRRLPTTEARSEPGAPTARTLAVAHGAPVTARRTTPDTPGRSAVPRGLGWPPASSEPGAPARSTAAGIVGRLVADEIPGEAPHDTAPDPFDAGAVAVAEGIARRVDPTEVRFAAPGQAPGPGPASAVARAATALAERAPEQQREQQPAEVVAAGPAAAPAQDLGALADELWERLELRLRTDLMLERERRGTWPDA
ncbi:hypothetical protein [Cellulomonas xylanilytica]|uniref:hypothetical protein n=1 Tax=Cellulomonas xylanilytica TaxID=233583 RepID=UPI0011BE07BA|nr:hypothetical protein [Cellulomonas xylanilytica]